MAFLQREEATMHKLEVVPCTDGSYDFVCGHDIIGSAANYERAVTMLFLSSASKRPFIIYSLRGSARMERMA